MKMSITMSTEMFHERLKNAYKSVKVTNAVSTIIRLRVDEFCEPLQKKEKKKNTIVLSSIATVMLAVVIAVGASMMQTEDTGIDLDEAASSIVDIEATSDYTAEITIENYGTITLALFSEVAPETVANFVSLAESGFYAGLTFHRIMDGFMMQGGDPSGDGTGGSENTITGEFSANGFENNLSHSRGAILMARADDYNSASSQFFIVHEDSTFLDGQYAVFGYVTEGMDIVDMICTTAEPTDDNGTIPPEEQPVITSISIQAIGKVLETEGAMNIDIIEETETITEAQSMDDSEKSDE